MFNEKILKVAIHIFCLPKLRTVDMHRAYMAKPNAYTISYMQFECSSERSLVFYFMSTFQNILNANIKVISEVTRYYNYK
jgi:hypothetical protein